MFLSICTKPRDLLQHCPDLSAHLLLLGDRAVEEDAPLLFLAAFHPRSTAAAGGGRGAVALDLHTEVGPGGERGQEGADGEHRVEAVDRRAAIGAAPDVQTQNIQGCRRRTWVISNERFKIIAHCLFLQTTFFLKHKHFEFEMFWRENKLLQGNGPCCPIAW